MMYVMWNTTKCEPAECCITEWNKSAEHNVSPTIVIPFSTTICTRLLRVFPECVALDNVDHFVSFAPSVFSPKSYRLWRTLISALALISVHLCYTESQADFYVEIMGTDTVTSHLLRPRLLDGFWYKRHCRRVGFSTAVWGNLAHPFAWSIRPVKSLKVHIRTNGFITLIWESVTYVYSRIS